DHVNPFNDTIYTWGVSGAYRFDIGFMIDRLSSLLMIVVTFVSLMVHIYSIGYMNDDPGYQRFFCYMSLFTFFMLMLVMANNFLQLFFGWEGVGLVSYLLIGFWYKKESANVGSLKAFIVNRIGDLGFIVGIAAILDYCNTLDYSTVFTQASYLASTSIQVLPGLHWSLLSVICILLFIGAMGKSAQMPLHVWLPESMEGPTPISALIHAATMVTAGIFMVARLSPLFAYSEAALSFMLVIGASTALFTGILGLVQYDIKRVIAYSTLSQLGYMVAALGASAFSAGIFHLVTHAFFKALLFLAAGSVIVALHHEQDMRKMGGLRKYMPVTYVTFLIGGLALSAIPPFAGFYSKDIIIDAVHLTTIPGATYAYVCLLLGAFVTALYTFRAVFYAFHTEERFDDHVKSHLKESPWVIWVPLILLAIPSVLSGALLVSKLIYGAPGLLGNTVTENPSLNVLKIMTHEYHGAINSIWQAFSSLPLWFALAGIFTAWVCYIAVPSLPGKVVAHFKLIYRILIHKYGFDAFNQKVFVQGTQKLSDMLFKICDVKFIDDWFINGSGRLINWLSSSTRRLQTGYIYHYTMVMVCGLIVFLVWLFW
ncbi:MAG: NADH-quinone oxidoreductase subunit L, partial [Gammaproteobacteria bacterium]